MFTEHNIDEPFDDVTFSHSAFWRSSDNRLQHLYIDNYMESNSDGHSSFASNRLVLPKFGQDTSLPFFSADSNLLFTSNEANQVRYRASSKLYFSGDMNTSTMEMNPQHTSGEKFGDDITSLISVDRARPFRLFPRLSRTTALLLSEQFPTFSLNFGDVDFLEFSSYDFTEISDESPDY
jgi:hypothetical protein